MIYLYAVISKIQSILISCFSY